MHPRLQNKANWTYCIKSKAALIKLYPNDLKQKTSHNQAFMPCGVCCLDVKGEITRSPETLIYQGFSHMWVFNSSSKNDIFSLRGNKSRNALFDS